MCLLPRWPDGERLPPKESVYPLAEAVAVVMEQCSAWPAEPGPAASVK